MRRSCRRRCRPPERPRRPLRRLAGTTPRKPTQGWSRVGAGRERVSLGGTQLLDARMDLVEGLDDGGMMALVHSGSDLGRERGDLLARAVSEQAERNVTMLAPVWARAT